MEVLLEMLRQMSERERKRIEEILQTHPASREMLARFGEKCEAAGKAAGEAKKAREIICRYLARRFGPESAALQQMVLQITSLQSLDDVMEELFSAGSLAEALAIIQGVFKEAEKREH